MYIKSLVLFRPKKLKNFYFKFIDWFYISSFVVEFTPFLNMEKMNSQLPSGLKTLRIFTLNLLIDSIFIAFSLSLLYSLRQYGKKEKRILKHFVSYRNWLYFIFCFWPIHISSFTIRIQVNLKIRSWDFLYNFVEEKSLRDHLLSDKRSKPSSW